MTIGTRGPFNFAVAGIKKALGLIRSSDGRLIELAKCFIDGGEHVNNLQWDHAYLHKGHRFEAGTFNASLTDGASIEILLRVSAANQAHLQWPPIVEAAGDCTVELLRGVNVSNAGAALIAFNMCDGISGGDDSSTVTPRSGGGMAYTGGTQRGVTHYVPGGSGPLAGGGTSESRHERVLAASTDYVVKVTNISGQPKRVHVILDWYDHEPITAKDQV